MKILTLILGILLIGGIYAAGCSDSFRGTSDIIQVCGVCLELNGSVCSPERLCNMTIYHPNLTLFLRNVTADNYGDGRIVLNITQTLSDGSRNLTDGNYIGEQYCSPRSRDDFSFTIGTPQVISAGYSGGGRSLAYTSGGETILILNETVKDIPADIRNYIEYGASKLSPSNLKRGRFFILILLIFFFFSQEIYRLIKKVRVKKKW